MLRQQFSSTDGKGGKKVYELSISALPRYYWTHYNHGVQNIQMIMAGATGKELGASGHFVESSRLSFIYWYTNGTQVRSRPEQTSFTNVDILRLLLPVT